MMRAAKEAAMKTGRTRMRVIGVTVLTSLKKEDLKELGIYSNPATLVSRWSKLALECGLDGVVCSGQEAAAVRQTLGDDFIIVTPGIRLPTGNKDDQARIVTPEMAITDGANYLVVCDPFTETPNANA